MTKKYCQNCKYFNRDERGNNSCRYVMREKDTPVQIRKVYHKIRIANKNNDCPDYDRVWYMFWIKK